jgi:UDP-N-acetylmuramoylalanine--D-glutamate ligase
MAGRKLALFGLGGSGMATALALKAGGADVLAYDDNPTSIEKAQAAGLPTLNLRKADWSDFAALVLSPGVPLTHPEPHWTVGLAQSAGIEIIGDIELFCRERAKLAPDAPFVAITGTNGKSTTTALVAHVLRHAGGDVQMGGNIGTAVLSLRPPARGRVHVIEMSSFQIDLTPSLAPTVGVLLNITPDHLDRHGTMEDYAAIKERLVARAEVPVVGIDDAPSRVIAERLQKAGREVLALSADMLPGDGYHFEAPASSRLREPRPPVADLRGSLAARHAQRPECGSRDRCREALGLAPEGDRGRPRLLPRLRQPDGGGRGAAAPSCSSTIQRPRTPIRPRRRCPHSSMSSGSLAARRRRAGSSLLGLCSPRSTRPI